MGFKRVQHISVTLDFLIELQAQGGLEHAEKKLGRKMDILRNQLDLDAALYSIGFAIDEMVEVDDKENKGQKKLVRKPLKIDKINNVDVRCNDRPYLARKCTVFAGRMRDNFEFKRLYDNIDILDVKKVPSWAATQEVGDFAFDIPVNEKVNTRKYTKRQDRQEDEGVDYTPEQLDQLISIFDGSVK